MSDDSLVRALGYAHSPGNAVQRGLRRVAGTRFGAAALSRTLRHADGIVGRRTQGRHSAASLATGLSVLTLTTTGRRSGVARTSPLIATPLGDDLALLGTNFGQSSTPAWALNLEANPECVVGYRGLEVPALARHATPEEADVVFDLASRSYVGYAHYRERIGDSRRIRVFVLALAR
ncbi:nitroreductase family deazaflavin-dependent oxidoreductase [Knoellia sp. CPCC 206450]|uniref:nitroreductase family deazaflavin-dependent oxidoreductase n=1 Tax=Knoellia tibetensis TaxID=3404798 RepID=UPI003B42AE02